MAGDPEAERVIFLESGLVGDHSEHCARDLARFVLLDVYLKAKGNCYYIAG